MKPPNKVLLPQRRQVVADAKPILQGKEQMQQISPIWIFLPPRG
jgi:hypothetical protein